MLTEPALIFLGPGPEGEPDFGALVADFAGLHVLTEVIADHRPITAHVFLHLCFAQSIPEVGQYKLGMCRGSKLGHRVEIYYRHKTHKGTIDNTTLEEDFC
jgi:hypothetical protein